MTDSEIEGAVIDYFEGMSIRDMCEKYAVSVCTLRKYIKIGIEAKKLDDSE